MCSTMRARIRAIALHCAAARKYFPAALTILVSRSTATTMLTRERNVMYHPCCPVLTHRTIHTLTDDMRRGTASVQNSGKVRTGFSKLRLTRARISFARHETGAVLDRRCAATCASARSPHTLPATAASASASALPDLIVHAAQHSTARWHLQRTTSAHEVACFLQVSIDAHVLATYARPSFEFG
ncbi:uncharacterized protein K441DRAFT_61461 [Cenococcum geophilum 1.58]|uniref:uncharacterized protein n=1 Tax=Cenococcum geophilum 1.58 TaxID=794803 RepID=UPI00358F6E2C|nr:hypothetical protein K441DRAFT_61461 [Cenococcum geophilum 1.58]